MFIGIDRDEVIEFISSMDPDKDNPTRFLLGVIPCLDRTILAAKFETKEDPRIFYDVVKKGLKGIKGMKTKSGEVKDYTVISDEVLDLLHSAVVKEIFFKIVGINFMTEQEIKN